MLSLSVIGIPVRALDLPSAMSLSANFAFSNAFSNVVET